MNSENVQLTQQSMKFLKKLSPVFAAGMIFTTGCATAQTKHSEYFTNWPAGTSPAEVGKRVAENVFPRKFRFEANPERASSGVIYPEVIAWYGSLTVAQLAGDKELTSKLTNKFERFLNEPD